MDTIEKKEVIVDRSNGSDTSGLIVLVVVIIRFLIWFFVVRGNGYRAPAANTNDGGTGTLNVDVNLPDNPTTGNDSGDTTSGTTTGGGTTGSTAQQ